MSWKFWEKKKKDQKNDILKVNDIVVCIDDRDWNGNTNIRLKYGKTYCLVDIVTCPSCGHKSYDLGGRFINSEQYTRCGEGDDDHVLPGEGIHWVRTTRVRKATEEETKKHYGYYSEYSKLIEKIKNGDN